MLQVPGHKQQAPLLLELYFWSLWSKLKFVTWILHIYHILVILYFVSIGVIDALVPNDPAGEADRLIAADCTVKQCTDTWPRTSITHTTPRTGHTGAGESQPHSGAKTVTKSSQ